MSRLDINSTVGDWVVQRPARSRIFEELGIDYCCGGKKPLAEACRAMGLDPETVVRMLDAAEQSGGEANGTEVDPASISLTELADHIEQTHHAYLRRELPRLDAMTEKVSSVHGEREPRLREIRSVFIDFVSEINSHMMKEERILFPLIRQLEAAAGPVESHCGSIANPIRQMEFEHDTAGNALERFRSLTDGFAPPEWACNTFRAMVDGLSELERDMHRHIHKENNVLFPRALERERQMAGR